jgi:hypothetical protein
MAEIVKKLVDVINAKYIEEVDSIVILGECGEGRLTHQLNRSLFRFKEGSTENDIRKEMKKTAQMMVGKKIWMEFNPGEGPYKESSIILP